MSILLKVKNHASVSKQKVSWKNQTFLSLFWIVKPIMIIKTIIAIVTVLAIKTNMAENIIGAFIINT